METISMRMFFFILSMILHVSLSEIAEDFSTISCLNESLCDDQMSTDISTIFSSSTSETTTEEDEDYEWEMDFDSIGIPRRVNTSIGSSHSPKGSPGSSSTPVFKETFNNIGKQSSVNKTNSSICPCDLTVSECDMNCCCDFDCHVYQLDTFSRCSDVKPKVYDFRYCYKKNFIKKNRTQFILDRITDNLFCIARDNLPPIYTIVNLTSIKSRKALDDFLDKELGKGLSWMEPKIRNSEKLNISKFYIYGDHLWSIKEKSMKSFELPLGGFNGLCTLKKKVKFSEDWESNCLQTDLKNENLNLFVENYSNMTVLSSPGFLNSQYKISFYLNCPKNVCVPIDTKICENSTKFCNSTIVPKGLCTNGTCMNIVKKIELIFYHNGTAGMKKVKLNVELGNFSKSYYQYFEVKFKWIDSENRESMIRSGNPGYVFGKPILIGIKAPNNTGNIINDQIRINQSNYFLNIPVGSKGGRCLEEKRLTVAFGENVKSKCSVSVETENFSKYSCIDLHKKILKHFFEDSLTKISTIENFPVHISSAANISNSNISDWSQILLNRIPKNIVTAQQLESKIRCSGLATTLRIDILYSLLPKSSSEDHHRIKGVGMTISEEEDIIWDKCQDDNEMKKCTDVLNVDIITYVSFHDISTPIMYYYAGGPHIRITVPYDFFYPFFMSPYPSMSRSHSAKNAISVFSLIPLVLSYLFL